MTTYTIALLEDMLAATAPDGDVEMMAERLADILNQVTTDLSDQVRYISGLTLFATVEDAEKAGAEIVYIDRLDGLVCFEDAEGRMEYMAAGRA